MIKIRRLLFICLLLGSSQGAWALFGYYCQGDSDLDGVGYGGVWGPSSSACPAGNIVRGTCSCNIYLPGDCNRCVTPSGENDNCPVLINPEQENTDGDTEGNACDADDDNDGVLDVNDNFPLDATESLDSDNDTIGNNADGDDDNDGVPDAVDAAPLNAGDTSEIALPLDGAYKGSQLKGAHDAIP